MPKYGRALHSVKKHLRSSDVRRLQKALQGACQSLDPTLAKRLVEVVKRNRLIFTASLMDLLGLVEELSGEDSIRQLRKDFSLFRQMSVELRTQKKQHDSFLKNLPVSRVLVHLAFYCEQVRIDKPQVFLHNNESLILLIQRILERRVKFSSNRELKEFTDVGKIKEAILGVLESHRQQDDEYHGMQGIITWYDQVDELEYLISLYCLHGWRIEHRSSSTAELMPQDDSQRVNWAQIQNRYNHQTDWYVRAVTEYPIFKQLVTEGDPGNSIAWNSLTHNIRYLATGLPPVVDVGESQFDSLNYFWLLNNISLKLSIDLLCGRASDNYLDHLSILTREIAASTDRDGFTTPFLTVCHKTNLRDDISQNCEIEPTEVNTLLDYISVDLTRREDIDLHFTPLMRVGDWFIGLPFSMVNKTFSTILHNRTFKEFEERHPKILSSIMESQIDQLFQRRDFKTMKNVPLIGEQDEELGEIDVLAYKDRTLFVIEAKTTYARQTARQIQIHTETLQEAAHQLDRGIEYVRVNYTYIAEQLGVSEPLDELTIYPLIISSSFEGDYTVFGGYKKITLFELNVILTDSKCFFYQESLVNPATARARYSIWGDTSLCTATDVINAIEHQAIWQGLLPKYIYPETATISVGETALTYTY